MSVIAPLALIVRVPPAFCMKNPVSIVPPEPLALIAVPAVRLMSPAVFTE